MKRIMNIIGSVIIILIVSCWFTCLCLVIDDYSTQLDDAKTKLSESNKTLDTVQSELEQIQYDYQLEIERATQLSNDLEVANDELANIKSELETANVTIDDLKSNEYKLVYMGDFKITYYCDERYSHICGGNGVTASGKPTEVGATAAADWSVLPKGSKVYIEGIGFREIQDVGGSVNGKHIDVIVHNHQEALNLGTDYEGVWLLVKSK